MVMTGDHHVTKRKYLNLPFIAPAQAQKHITHNEALRMLDALVQMSVINKTEPTPPNNPGEGARYIIAENPVGI